LARVQTDNSTVLKAWLQSIGLAWAGSSGASASAPTAAAMPHRMAGTKRAMAIKRLPAV
jgi:hypothetical protein